MADAEACQNFQKERYAAGAPFPGRRPFMDNALTPIESVFAVGRHRTVRTKGTLSRQTVKLLIFKLVQAAAKPWRRLKGANQLPMVTRGVTSTGGVAANATATRAV